MTFAVYMDYLRESSVNMIRYELVSYFGYQEIMIYVLINPSAPNAVPKMISGRGVQDS